MDHRIRLSPERSSPLMNNDIWCSLSSATRSPLNSHSLIFPTSFAAYQTKGRREVPRPRGDKRPAKALRASPLLPPRNDWSYDGKKLKRIVT
jgi:hypothetical protein